MGFVVELDELKKASFLRSVASRQYEYFKLSWGTGVLNMYSYNGTLITRVSLECETSDIDEAVLRSDKWWAIVSNAAPGQLMIEKLRSNLRISSGSQEVKLRMIPSEHFVDVTRVFSCSRNTLGALVGKAFKEGMQRVVYAASTDARPHLQTVQFVLDSDSEWLGMFATNGIKIAGARVPAKIEESRTYLIPSSTINHWTKLVADKEMVRIFGDNNLVGIEFGPHWSTTQTVSGSFPPVDQFLKPPEVPNFILAKSDLRRALQQALVFNDAMTSSMVELTAEGSSVKLSAEGEVGAFKETLRANVSIPLTALVNPEMVLDVLHKVPGDYLVVSQEKELTPLYLRGEVDSGISIVMPLRKKQVKGDDGDF